MRGSGEASSVEGMGKLAGPGSRSRGARWGARAVPTLDASFAGRRSGHDSVESTGRWTGAPRVTDRGVRRRDRESGGR